jgi:hypothetical protein
MATNMEDSPRSPEVQRAQAEERRQRLEEEKRQLEIKHDEREERKQEVERVKIVIDVLKHVSTVITALLFILASFGDQIIPRARETSIPYLDLTMWDLAVISFYISLMSSLVGIMSLADTLDVLDRSGPNRLSGTILKIIAIALVVAMLVVVLGMGVLGRTP